MSDEDRPAGRQDDLDRIQHGLEAAGRILKTFTPGEIEARRKSGGDPVTEADLQVDAALLEILPRKGEGWLSEETRDSADRLGCSRLWVVDPVDGTREFVSGIPEFCISIGLVEQGEAVAGGIYNPATEQMVVGAIGVGVTLNGERVTARQTADLTESEVLASRSEVNRGEWDRFKDGPFKLRPMGSVAFKMGLVGAGLSEATWTLVPKNEWDIAAGVALIRASGGEVRTKQWGHPRFNQSQKTLLDGLIGCGPNLLEPIRELLGLG